jgi:ABC-type phosphate transport system substrate-binding protein
MIRTIRVQPAKTRAVALLALLLSVVAHADIYVIANEANTSKLDELSICKMYLGGTLNLPEGKTASPVDQSEKTAAKDEFYTKLLRVAPNHIKSYWTQQKFTGGIKPLPSYGNDDAVAKYVAETPNAIGYVQSDKLPARVKVLFKL